VCAAALTWLHACPSDSHSDIFTLLSSVRLEYLDPSYIRHRILDDQVQLPSLQFLTFNTLHYLRG